jgi:hypothetical protein
MIEKRTGFLSAALALPLFLVTLLLTGPELMAAALSPTGQSGPDAPSDWIMSLPIMRDSRPLGPALPPPQVVSATAPIDFAAIRTDLRRQGLDLAFNKIGFHTGTNGNTTGLDEWMAALDAAGIPIFLKSVDNAEPIYKAQQLAKASGVPHTLVFRRTNGSGGIYDTPNYDLAPAQAAAVHWQLHKDSFPPELDPSMVWMETVNEVDKDRSEWLAQFALETAKLALADGHRWAAFAWSSGEPEPEHWDSPAMLEFLRLAGENPEFLAIALHEYSYSVSDIGRFYPYLLGRFQALFEVCDAHGIPRPTILITEWGWESNGVPTPELAMKDIEWASWLYAAYPQVRGAATWYLGSGVGYGDIADQVQKLIAPVTDYSLSHYFVIEQGQGEIDPSLLAPMSQPQPKTRHR